MINIRSNFTLSGSIISYGACNMSFAQLQTYYKTFLTKESSMENAVSEARDEGHDDFNSEISSGMKRANKIMEAIKRKESYKTNLEEKFEAADDIEKATYAARDTAAVATARVKRDYGITAFGPGSKGAGLRDAIAAAIDKKHGPGSYGATGWPQATPGALKSRKKKKGESEQKMEKQFPPELASLMSAAAGWAFSSDVGKVGQMTPEQSREWERTLSAADRRKMERSMRSKMRRKSVDKTLDKSTFDALKEYYNDSSDEYIKRSPEQNDFLVQKDHSILPPRQGLMWDAVKHRWTKPENVGHTVTEVQGKKRYRAAGSGAHERSVGGHGSGKSRQVEAGRRFKGQADVGALKPHENKRPAGHAKHKKV